MSGVIEEGTIEDFLYVIYEHPDLGHLNGYLAVPPGHPWYGVDKDHVDIEVHGGTTFTASSLIGSPHMIRKLEKDIAGLANVETIFLLNHRKWQLEQEIEHQGEWSDFPIEVHMDVWWIGFDCGHAWDIQPGLVDILRRHGLPDLIIPGATFKDRDYVYGEILKMVQQAIEAEKS